LRPKPARSEDGAVPRQRSGGCFLGVLGSPGAQEINHPTIPDHLDVHRFVFAVVAARWLWEP
jgi:hypothetical protein